MQLQPANDDFADATPFRSTDLETQYLAVGLATVEPGEPAHGRRATTHSAWFSYTPTRNERLRVDVCDANYSAVSSTAAIYRGTALHSLTEVASSETQPGCGNTGQGGQVEALLVAGAHYRIAVTQDGAISEAVDVVHATSPRDDSATTPSKLSNGTIDLRLATREAQEPDHAGHAGGRSRWKVVTPDVSMTYEVSTCPKYTAGDPAPDALLAVYEGAEGTPPGELTPITAEDDGCPTGDGALVRFRALAGHRYLIAIDSKGGAPGTFV